MNGYIHSFQSLGTVDGPGVRFVVFFQGCPLRCHCCHNPDTWVMTDGAVYDVETVVERIGRYRTYFGEQGGVTASGGEPLMQPQFLRELFRKCREQGIHTCLDTSGAILNEAVYAALEMTDRVLLDIKYTTEEQYKQYVGGSLERTMAFLDALQERQIPVTVRQVIVPGIHDTEDNITALEALIRPYSCVDGVELLPFRKLCQSKYDELGIPFPFAAYPEASKDTVRRLAEYSSLCLYNE
ncbi:MAG: pyruvate formate lyase-activating protein [Clostridia bacterium]|nr:pyruvate formate lyase-activating protein [Clostridia bacterium]